MTISDNYDFDYFKEKSVSLEYLDKIISTHEKPVHIFFVYSFGEYSELLEVKIGHDCLETTSSDFQYLGSSVRLRVCCKMSDWVSVDVNSKDLGIGEWSFTNNLSFDDKKDAELYLKYSKEQEPKGFSNRTIFETLNKTMAKN